MEKPLNFKQLKKRKALKPKQKYPSYTVELNRIWHSKDSLIIPSIRTVKGEKNCSIIESVVSKNIQTEPPNIQTQKAKANKRRLRDSKLFNGDYKTFHSQRTFPKVKERIKKRKLGKGEDNPTNVFGTDTRYIYNDVAFPWCTVGKVETASGSASGCMIGRNLMLTCSHAINWNGDGTAGWIRFSPAYYNGVRNTFGSAFGERVFFWNQAVGGLTDFETAFDYVVVVLDRNLGDITGFAGFRTYNQAWNNGDYWQHMGYPGDLTGTERPAFFGNGAITSISQEQTSGQTGFVMGHFMDITGGHSGGPYWGWWGDEPWPRVVGVQSAESGTPAMNTSGDNEAGGGPALSSLIAFARANA